MELYFEWRGRHITTHSHYALPRPLAACACIYNTYVCTYDVMRVGTLPILVRKTLELETPGVAKGKIYA